MDSVQVINEEEKRKVLTMDQKLEGDFSGAGAFVRYRIFENADDPHTSSLGIGPFYDEQTEKDSETRLVLFMDSFQKFTHGGYHHSKAGIVLDEEARKIVAKELLDGGRLKFVDFNIEDYLRRQVEWSTKAFGPGDRTEGVMKHMESEINEVRASEFGSQERLEELCDLAILTMDAVWRNGFTAAQFVQMLEAKQAKNIKRKWPAPLPPDQAAFHVKE